MRDNVIFETGLFMGSHGRSQTFLITPYDVPDLHIPTDLLGITPATYDGERAKSEPSHALYAVALKIQETIQNVGANERKLDIVRSARREPGATWPLKGFFKLSNHHQSSVALRSLRFDFVSSAPRATQCR